MTIRSFARIATGAICLIFFNSNAQDQKSSGIKDVFQAQYKCKNLSFNSSSSDFGLFPFGTSSYFFSSNRPNDKGTNAKQTLNLNGLPFLDIYMVMKSGESDFTSPAALPGSSESKYNEGPVFFDPVSNSFYITRNHYNKKRSEQNRNGLNRLKIYIENIDGTTFKAFGEFQHNNDKYSVGHAALSPDGQTIYFSSDMPGGIGGSDLYACQKEGDRWSAPRNLGPAINTAGSELYPFISADGKLYFSSNGHSQQTGLDILCAEINGAEVKAPKKLGAPFNSETDDFAFYIYPDNRSGFFSSNRPGGQGDDDIYSFELDNPVINGLVLDAKSGSPMANARVKILDDALKVTELTTDAEGKFSHIGQWGGDYTVEARQEGFTPVTKSIATKKDGGKFEMEFKLVKEEYGLDGMVLSKDNNKPVAGVLVTLEAKVGGQTWTVTTDEGGSFRFGVKPNMEYLIRTEKVKFLASVTAFSTQGMAIGVKKQNVIIEELVVGKSIKVDNVYYDLGKWDIRPDAKVELDKLVELMKDNPTMEIELSSHTDSRGSDASNLSLSDKRAKAVAAYVVSKGIDAKRVTGKGYGETKLLNKCKNGVKCSDGEHQMNRRTEFKILKM